MLTSFKRHIGQTLEWMAEKGASCYIAGTELRTALELCDTIERGGSRFIICPWDKPGDSALTVYRSYDRALRTLRNERRRGYFLSVKLPSLRFNAAMAESLVVQASEACVRIHFDALTPDSVEPTMKLLARLRGRYSNIGYTIPARWRRSGRDIEAALDLEIPVRIVKGQLPARRGEEVAPLEGYINLVARARRARSLIGIATHDESLAELSLEALRSAGVSCELEQLYRLRPVAPEFRGGAPVRLYVPYGTGYPPYDIYEACRKPRVGFRLVRDFSRGVVHAAFRGRKRSGGLVGATPSGA